MTKSFCVRIAQIEKIWYCPFCGKTGDQVNLTKFKACAILISKDIAIKVQSTLCILNFLFLKEEEYIYVKA